MSDEEKKYVIGSYFMNEESEWGWKYGFTLNKELTTYQMIEVVELIQDFLNSKKTEIIP